MTESNSKQTIQLYVGFLSAFLVLIVAFIIASIVASAKGNRRLTIAFVATTLVVTTVALALAGSYVSTRSGGRKSCRDDASSKRLFKSWSRRPSGSGMIPEVVQNQGAGVMIVPTATSLVSRPLPNSQLPLPASIPARTLMVGNPRIVASTSTSSPYEPSQESGQMRQSDNGASAENEESKGTDATGSDVASDADATSVIDNDDSETKNQVEIPSSSSSSSSAATADNSESRSPVEAGAHLTADSIEVPVSDSASRSSCAASSVLIPGQTVPMFEQSNAGNLANGVTEEETYWAAKSVAESAPGLNVGIGGSAMMSGEDRDAVTIANAQNPLMAMPGLSRLTNQARTGQYMYQPPFGPSAADVINAREQFDAERFSPAGMFTALTKMRMEAASSTKMPDSMSTRRLTPEQLAAFLQTQARTSQ